MTLNEYQKLAMTTCMESCKNDTYMLFGLMAEVGEVADKIAKWKRKGIIRIDGSKLVFMRSDTAVVETYKKELLAELGDCLWFIAGIASVMGVHLEDIGQQNYDKWSGCNQSGNRNCDRLYGFCSDGSYHMQCRTSIAWKRQFSGSGYCGYYDANHKA